MTATGTTALPRLDRVGRALVRLGSLVTAVFVALPAFLFALLTLGFADSGTTIEGLMFMAALMAFAVTVMMMLRGGTRSLALGGIGAFIIGSVALLFTTRQDIEWFVFLGQVALVAASAFALALGAAFRLIARDQMRHRARPDGVGPSGS